jgi:hypothetical protein
MTVWNEDVDRAVRAALAEVQLAEPARNHFGRPYITAYQLAIKVHRLMPDLAERLQRAADHGENFGIEAALLSNTHVSAMTFTRPDGGRLDSSNVGSGYDLSLFRLTDPV